MSQIFKISWETCKFCRAGELFLKALTGHWGNLVLDLKYSKADDTHLINKELECDKTNAY